MSSAPLDSLEDVLAATLALAGTARREIAIYAPALEPAIYNTREFHDAALQFIHRSRHTRLRILAADTRLLDEQCRLVVALVRQAEEQCFLRKTSSYNAEIQPAYLVCDDHSLVRRQNAAQWRGVCYTEERARAKLQLEEFDQLWGQAAPDPNLRRISL